MTETAFFINSIDRENYATTDPSNCRINLKKTVMACAVEIDFMQVPNIFYNITSANNTFTENGITYSVAPGSYTLDQLLQAIAGLNNNWGLIFNDITQKLSWSAVAGSLNINFTVVGNSIGRVLGFANSVYVGASITGEFPPKLYDAAIFVSINMSTSISTSCDNLNNVSFVVPINVNKNEIIQYYRMSQYVQNPKIHQQNLQHFDVKLFDERGQLLQSCGDWSMLFKVFPRALTN